MNALVNGQQLIPPRSEAIAVQRPVARARETRSWKRSLDLALLALASPVIAPVMLLVAATIKLVSRGPVFFVQERVGLRGCRFQCFKFRTMHSGSDPVQHREYLRQLMTSAAPMAKLDGHDPRLIRFGRVLRASGLDELPQVFNVLRGDMSLVGPRPCTSYEYEGYQDGQRERFEALPGVTGLWQVSGKNRTTFEEMIRFDIEYARNQSLGLDLKILARTIPVLITQVRETAARRAKARNRPE